MKNPDFLQRATVEPIARVERGDAEGPPGSVIASLKLADLRVGKWKGDGHPEWVRLKMTPTLSMRLLRYSVVQEQRALGVFGEREWFIRWNGSRRIQCLATIWWDKPPLDPAIVAQVLTDPTGFSQAWVTSHTKVVILPSADISRVSPEALKGLPGVGNLQGMRQKAQGNLFRQISISLADD